MSGQPIFYNLYYHNPNLGHYGYILPYPQSMAGFQLQGKYAIQPAYHQHNQYIYHKVLTNINGITNTTKNINPLRSDLNPKADPFCPSQVINQNIRPSTQVTPEQLYYSNLNPNAYIYYPRRTVRSNLNPRASTFQPSIRKENQINNCYSLNPNASCFYPCRILKSSLNPRASTFHPSTKIFNNNQLNPIHVYYSNSNPNVCSYYTLDMWPSKGHQCCVKHTNLQPNVVELQQMTLNDSVDLSQGYNYENNILNDQQSNENDDRDESLVSLYEEESLLDQTYEDHFKYHSQSDDDSVNSTNTDLYVDCKFPTYPSRYELDFLESMRQYEREYSYNNYN